MRATHTLQTIEKKNENILSSGGACVLLTNTMDAASGPTTLLQTRSSTNNLAYIIPTYCSVVPCLIMPKRIGT